MDADSENTPEDVRYWIAPEKTREEIGLRLGLERFLDAGLRIDQAEVVDDALRVHVDWESVGEGWFRFFRADDRPRFCGTRRVSIVFEGKEVSKAFLILMKRMTVSIGDAYIEDFLDMVPESVNPGGPPSSGQGRASTINTWNPEESWRSFLCDHAMQRKFFESFDFDGPSAFIIHGDLECQFVSPRSPVSLPRFFNYPWPLNGGSDGGAGGGFTDLDDLDVIQGGQEKLDRAVREEISKIGDEGPVIVNSTCVPVVIGDDIDLVLDNHRGECPQGLYHVGPQTMQPVDIFMEYVIQVRDEYLGEKREVRERSVALVGFRDEPARDELIRLLEEIGISVTGCILPLVSLDMVRKVLDAQILVFRPSEYHSHLYEQMFAGLDRVRIQPEAPWGYDLTSKWLEAVADAVGLDWEAETALSGLTDSTGRPQTEDVLGFVIEPGQEKRLLAPDSGTGLPVLPVAHELGFSVRLFLYSADISAYRDSLDRLATMLSRMKEVEILGFGTPDELAKQLREPDLGAVFSEYFFDWRLSRTGTAQFSARDFEMGFEGAARTKQRLQNLLELPFYRKFSHHLDSTRLGRTGGQSDR